jgi:hypothetical protein
MLTQFIVTHYRENIFGIEEETTLTSFKNAVNTEAPITVARKAQQFPRISRHLRIAE